MKRKASNFWEGGCYYDPRRDGTIEEYLTLHDGHSSFPLFKGSKQFHMLWDEGYIDPIMTTVRVMWNVGREDEHFNVIDRETIEGISDAPAHAGREGRHDVTLLDKVPSYEIHYPLTKALREYKARRKENEKGSE